MHGIVKSVLQCTFNFYVFVYSLADLATLHGHITQKYGLTERNTWISFGGSYPGALSAWFRIKVFCTKWDNLATTY